MTLKNSKYQWTWFSIVALGIFSYDGSLGMLLPVVPLFLKQLDLSEAFLGLPLLVFGIGWLFGSLLFAYLMRIYNQRKIFLIVAFTVLIGCGLSTAFLVSLSQFLIMLFLQGMAEGLVWQMGLLTISEIFTDAQQAVANGYLFASFNFATIIAPVISSFIFNAYQTAGFGTVMCILGGIGLVGSIILPEKLEMHTVSHPDSLTWKQMKHPAYISGLLLAFMSAGIRTAFETLISIILRDRFDVPNEFIGLYYLNISVPATIASLFMGHLSVRISEYKLIWLGISFCLISTFIILFSTSIIFTCFGLMCLSIGFVFTSSPIPSFLCKLLKTHPSSLHGSFNFFTAFGIAVYPLISGAIISNSGNVWTCVFLVASILVIVPPMILTYKYTKTIDLSSLESLESLTLNEI